MDFVWNLISSQEQVTFSSVSFIKIEFVNVSQLSIKHTEKSELKFLSIDSNSDHLMLHLLCSRLLSIIFL